MNVSSFFNYTEPLGNEDQSSPSTRFDFSLLSKWPSDHWNAFLELTQTLRFDRGDSIFEQGDVDSGFYLVAAGQFEVTLPRASGEIRIATIELGAILGEQGFLDHLPHTFAARATTEGELVRFTQTGYERLQARHPELAADLIWDLARIGSLRQRQTAMLLGE